MSCARGDRPELVARQATDAPLVEHMRAHAAIEGDRRLVPVEHRPFQAATLPALGDRRNVREQLLADATAAPLGHDEQILEIQTLLAEESREVVEEERKADGNVSAVGEDDLTGRPWTEERLPQILFGRRDFVRELLGTRRAL